MDDTLNQMREQIQARYQREADEHAFGAPELYPYTPSVIGQQMDVNPAGAEFSGAPGLVEAVTPKPGVAGRITGVTPGQPSGTLGMVNTGVDIANKGLSAATPFLRPEHQPQLPKVPENMLTNEVGNALDAITGILGHVEDSTVGPILHKALSEVGLSDESIAQLRHGLRLAIDIIGGHKMNVAAGVTTPKDVAITKTVETLAKPRGKPKPVPAEAR